jgi:hypothetical protein
MTADSVPVLTIDGPSGSGKGTISRLVAEQLGWHLLDSGALYRAVGYAAGAAGLDLSDAAAVTRCAETTKIRFRDPGDGGETRVIVNSHDATDEMRTETAAAAASAIAAIPGVRAALLDKQRGFRSSRSSSSTASATTWCCRRRAVVEASMGEERAKLMETLKEGAIVKGVVKNITEYGAFVDLGGIDGLLHITDMAWRRVVTRPKW